MNQVSRLHRSMTGFLWKEPKMAMVIAEGLRIQFVPYRHDGVGCPYALNLNNLSHKTNFYS